MAKFFEMLRDESGASAAEYTLILAIVGSVLAVAAIFLGDTIANSMEAQAITIGSCGDGAC